MADLKPISQFATASSVEANTLLFVSTPNQNNGYDSEKVSASELGEALVNDFEYTQDLQTAEKTITGGINELKAINGYSYDAYDDTTTSANAYSVGDLVIYNNTLYKCIATTYGAWDSTKWDETSIADELADLETGKQDAFTMKELSASDVFSDTTNIVDFYGYQIGKIVFISRLVVRGGTVVSGEIRYCNFKSGYFPVSPVRFLWDKGGSAVMVKGVWDTSNGLVIFDTDTTQQNYAYSFSFLKA